MTLPTISNNLSSHPSNPTTIRSKIHFTSRMAADRAVTRLLLARGFAMIASTINLYHWLIRNTTTYCTSLGESGSGSPVWWPRLIEIRAARWASSASWTRPVWLAVESHVIIQRFLLAADNFAIFAAPYFLRPILAATAPGSRAPPAATLALRDAKRAPLPSLGFAMSPPTSTPHHGI